MLTMSLWDRNFSAPLKFYETAVIYVVCIKTLLWVLDCISVLLSFNLPAIRKEIIGGNNNLFACKFEVVVETRNQYHSITSSIFFPNIPIPWQDKWFWGNKNSVSINIVISVIKYTPLWFVGLGKVLWLIYITPVLIFGPLGLPQYKIWLIVIKSKPRWERSDAAVFLVIFRNHGTE